MQLLISFQWIEGEAKEQRVKVSDADVKKQFDTQKKASFPKDADYQKFLEQSGQTEKDILMRVKLDLLSNKIRDKITKDIGKVTDADITKYYNENKARFAQPERRDLLVVLTKTRPRPTRPSPRSRAARRSARSPRSSRSTRSPRRRAASCRPSPRASRSRLRQGDLRGQEGRADRPGQDAVRLLRLQGHQDHAGLAADREAGRRRRSSSCSRRRASRRRWTSSSRTFTKKWKAKTELQEGLRDDGLQERPEADADAHRRGAGRGAPVPDARR